MRATVSATAPLHLVCHCDDCQDYVSWVALRRPASLGPLPTADLSGGVRTVQVFKRDIKLSDAGMTALLEVSCLDPALIPAGRPFKLLRAHATCCGTPLFNTWGALPSISFFAAAAATDGGSGAEALRRPPEWRLNTAWARGATPGSLVPAGSAGFSPLFLLRFIARNWWYAASHGAPSPFPLPGGDEAGACTVRQRAIIAAATIRTVDENLTR